VVSDKWGCFWLAMAPHCWLELWLAVAQHSCSVVSGIFRKWFGASFLSHSIHFSGDQLLSDDWLMILFQIAGSCHSELLVKNRVSVVQAPPMQPRCAGPFLSWHEWALHLTCKHLTCLSVCCSLLWLHTLQHGHFVSGLQFHSLFSFFLLSTFDTSPWQRLTLTVPSWMKLR